MTLDAERTPIPHPLREAYREWQWNVVSQWDDRIVTYRLSHPSGPVRYAKVVPTTWFPSASAEVERMRWASNYLPVPVVRQSGTYGAVDWFVMDALHGVNATHDSLREDPTTLVQLLAHGLRDFHRAPVADCPFGFRLDEALAHVRERARRGEIDEARDFHREHRHLTVDAAIEILEGARPREEHLVVCHGDYCFPNVLIEDDRVVGFVDLGELGVADRWWDLAVATWSSVWNLGDGFEQLFLDAYGVRADAERIAYYRLLYDLVS